MSAFFTNTTGSPGTVLFLNAGDPPLDQLHGLVLDMDKAGIDCLELAVPFPDSVTDGVVIRRSASRAIESGITLAQVLEFIRSIKPQLDRMKIVLLADWSHTVKVPGMAAFLAAVAASGADGLLIHALPPVLRREYLDVAAEQGIPVVTTCYSIVSRPETLQEAAHAATAYVYLVAKYGRSGSRPDEGYAALQETVAELRTYGTAPIAVGFGVTDRADIDQLGTIGADAAIIGTAAVAAVEDGLATGRLRPVFNTFLNKVSPPKITHTEGNSHAHSQA